MKRLIAVVTLVVALALPGTSHAGHLLRSMALDHEPPSFVRSVPAPTTFNAGGAGAEWDLVTTIPTGNPHTDIDFFTQRGETYASAGTLATGPNGGGQTIVQLTDRGEVSPRFVASHPSATCISDPSAALGLQHDIEATPKGTAPLNAANRHAVRSDTQLLIDATDAPGRCHDQGALGLSGVPQGGLEIIDVANVSLPVEIGLTSHIGEAHTVNVDPKRPHIAYAVTSDAIGVDEEGNPGNEDPDSSDRLDLDGFEVVDLSSCMYFRPSAPLDRRRSRCRPEVYRYRYPTAEMALGHTLKTGSQAVHGCHELEVYPSDLLTCASGNALIGLNMRGAFDDNGTPHDFTDDHPKGEPLPCRVRDSTSLPSFATGAKITDCVDGKGPGTEDLNVPNWLAGGAPSLEGVRWLGSIHHMGRGAGGAATPTFDSTQDIDFNHEAELSGSGKLLIATDERGGGVLPPGATCSPGTDNLAGNGGVHFYRRDGLHRGGPGGPKQEWGAYARMPGGKKAIYRAPVRTKPQATVCTAHVFQQIPGQNRIFMGWYSQGTQVLDFTERPDGRVKLEEAGWFIPENANSWVSHVFRYRRNANGTYTYWGATGDFNLGEAGRNAIDVYQVTLPSPPTPGGQ